MCSMPYCSIVTFVYSVSGSKYDRRFFAYQLIIRSSCGDCPMMAIRFYFTVKQCDLPEFEMVVSFL